jgi:hypothetical protein
MTHVYYSLQISDLGVRGRHLAMSLKTSRSVTYLNELIPLEALVTTGERGWEIENNILRFAYRKFSCFSV